MEKIKLDLIIERAQDDLAGRVTYNNNLIVDHAGSVNELENQLKQLLFDFEDLDPSKIEFEHYYDVYSLFEQFDFLNISKVAKHAGINAGLLRQYESGVKHPSAQQAKKIEDTIHKLAGLMNSVLVYAE